MTQKDKGRRPAAKRAAGEHRSPRRGERALAWLYAAVLVAVAVACYANSFDGVLVFDDQEALGANPSIRALWPPTRAMDAPKDTPLAGRPVANYTFAINYALAPADVRDVLGVSAGASQDVAAASLRNLRGYHAVNLAIHALAGLVLFGLVRRTLQLPRFADAVSHRATPVAACVAALWLAHPMNTAAVTYVAQRVESFAGLLYLLTLYCALRSREAERQRAWMAGSVIACALGVATKEIVATAPLAVVLFDRVFFPPNAAPRDLVPPETVVAPRMTPRWLLYLGLAATWLLLAAILATNPRPNSVGLFLRGWSPWTYLITQAGVLVHYLGLALWPTGLALDYGWPAAQSLADVWPQATLVVAILVATVAAMIRRHPAGFPLACFFLVLAPTSTVIPIVTEVAADHRMYLPLAALIALVVTGAAGGLAWLGRRTTPSAARLAGQASLAAAAALVVALGLATVARNSDYHSVEGIWADTVSKRPGSAMAHVNYGAALLATDRLGEAEPYLRRAIALDPKSPEAHSNLGVALCALGRSELGIPHLLEAVRLSPDYADAHRNLAEAYASQGQFAAAAKHYRTALEAHPDDVRLLNTIAWILATTNDDSVRDGRQALQLAERANRLTGSADPFTIDTLAAAYAEIGRFADATAAANRAVALARMGGAHDLAAEIEARIPSYSAGRAFRER